MRSIAAAFALLFALCDTNPDPLTPRVEVRSPDGRLPFIAIATGSGGAPTAPAESGPALVERGTASRVGHLTIAMRAGGGFIARFGGSR